MWRRLSTVAQKPTLWKVKKYSHTEERHKEGGLRTTVAQKGQDISRLKYESTKTRYDRKRRHVGTLV